MKPHLLVTRLILALCASTLLYPLQAQDASTPSISFEIDGVTYQLGYTSLNSQELSAAQKMDTIRHILQISGQKNIAQSYAFAREADKKGDSIGSYILALQSRDGVGVEKSLDRYIFRLKLAAEKNYAPALFELSRAYEQGLGVPSDQGMSRGYLQRAALLNHPAAMEKRGLILIQAEAYEDAFPFLAKAAKEGLAEANFQLGICYAHGLGSKADMNRSVEALTAAAEKGHIRAMGALCVIYREGLGVPPSPEKLKLWSEKLDLTLNRDDLKVSASNAYCTAMHLARRLVKTDKEALSILRDEAKKGNTLTIYTLALAHHAGLGQKQPNHTAAFTLMEKAAKTGLPQAEYAVGISYLYGTGCELDHDKGVAWLERAAEKDHASALAMLAIGYWGEDGYGIKFARNDKKALELNLRAAKLGNPVAQNHAGYMLYRGMGRKGTEEEIQHWFEQAGKNNYPSALFTLGERALIEIHTIKQKEGHFTPESTQKMYNYYRRAAELGHAIAMERLATCHEGLYGFKTDIEQRIYWLELGSEFGNINCSNDLADLYIKGRGVKRDIDRGIAVYERNIHRPNGNHGAARLGFLYYKGLYGVARDLVKSIQFYEQSRAPKTGHVTSEYHLHALLENAAREEQSPMRALELMQHEFNNLRSTNQYVLWLALQQLLKPEDSAYPHLDTTGLQNLKSKAQLGNEKAQYQLAISLLRGDAGRLDAKQARALLEELAQAGHLDALIDLSLYAMYGISEPADNKKALEYIEKLAQDKSEKAQLFAGLIAYRDVTTPDMRAYAPCLARAAELGNLDALYIQHKKCTFIQPELREQEKAVNLRLAHEGHLGAMIDICFFHAQNIKESLPILEKFAAMENGGAQYTLNCLYRFGKHGIAKDMEKADKWLEESAKNGYFEALKDMQLMKRPIPKQNKTSG